jgi:four helix bundle protein
MAQEKVIARRFEDLAVWQTARRLTRGVYKAVRTQRLGADSPLSLQMRRAAVSIGSNIAEGFEHGTRKREIECCYIAKGSAGELRSQVVAAHDVGLVSDKAYEWLHGTCEKVSRQLHAYIGHLQRTQANLPGAKHKPDRATPRRDGKVQR